MPALRAAYPAASIALADATAISVRALFKPVMIPCPRFEPTPLNSAKATGPRRSARVPMEVFIVAPTPTPAASTNSEPKNFSMSFFLNPCLISSVRKVSVFDLNRDSTCVSVAPFASPHAIASCFPLSKASSTAVRFSIAALLLPNSLRLFSAKASSMPLINLVNSSFARIAATLASITVKISESFFTSVCNPAASPAAPAMSSPIAETSKPNADACAFASPATLALSARSPLAVRKASRSARI